MTMNRRDNVIIEGKPEGPGFAVTWDSPVMPDRQMKDGRMHFISRTADTAEDAVAKASLIVGVPSGSFYGLQVIPIMDVSFRGIPFPRKPARVAR